jgi:hypothetical protein
VAAKEEGNEAYKRGEYAEAETLYVLWMGAPPFLARGVGGAHVCVCVWGGGEGVAVGLGMGRECVYAAVYPTFAIAYTSECARATFFVGAVGS